MKAVFYIRMSTDKQDNSIDSQRQLLELYAKNHNYNIINEYIDEGISGRLAKNRPNFMKMLEDSEKNLFNTILIYDSSRFARNLEEFIVYKSTLKRFGIKLISITEPNVDEDTALITDAMLGALNEMYSRKLSKAVKRGMLYKVQQGIAQTSVPYGYRRKNGRLKIINDEAIIVNKIFNMFSQTPTYHSIAVKLNELYIKKNDKLWSSIDIKRILLNRTYIGYISFDGKYYKGNHQSIINLELFEKVQHLISLKPKTKIRPECTYKHYLSGTLKCYHCGSTMHYTSSKKSSHSFRCGNNSKGKCKYSNFICVNKIEILFISSLENILKDKSLHNYKYFVDHNNIDLEINELEKSLKKIPMKLERCKKAYINGIDTIDEYNQNKIFIMEEKTKIINKIKSIKISNKKENFKEFKNKIGELYNIIKLDNFTIEQKSIAKKNLIEKIIVNKYSKEFIVYYYM